MRRVHVNKLKPGMIIGRTVMNANEHVLLSAGTVLTGRFISRLAKLNIPSVYIDDGFLPDLQYEDIIPDEIRYKTIQHTKKIFQEYQRTKSLVGMDKMESLVDIIIEELLDYKNIVINLADIRGNDEYTFGHCVNTCVLSLITAIKLGYSSRRLRQLAAGALLHDLGKTLIPQEIINKPGKLTAEEFHIVQKHSEYGYSILERNNHFENQAKLAVLHHHERFNGSGYPQGLIGNAIPEPSSIVGVADMYDALTADRVYRKAYSPYEAFEMLSASGDYLFDFNIIKAFLHHIAAYPLGCLVRLNTNEIGVIVENRPGLALRPKIRVLFLPNNEFMMQPYELDLAKVHNVTITQLVEDDALLNTLKNKIKINKIS